MRGDQCASRQTTIVNTNRGVLRSPQAPSLDLSPFTPLTAISLRDAGPHSCEIASRDQSPYTCPAHRDRRGWLQVSWSALFAARAVRVCASPRIQPSLGRSAAEVSCSPVPDRSRVASPLHPNLFVRCGAASYAFSRYALSSRLLAFRKLITRTFGPRFVNISTCNRPSM